MYEQIRKLYLKFYRILLKCSNILQNKEMIKAKVSYFSYLTLAFPMIFLLFKVVVNSIFTESDTSLSEPECLNHWALFNLKPGREDLSPTWNQVEANRVFI